MYIPQFQDVLLAQRQIRPYLQRTPLYSYPAINDLIGTSVYVKHENYHPVGAFKVRGGVNLVSQMSADERERGVIAASTGNHGQVGSIWSATLWRPSTYRGARGSQPRQGRRDARYGCRSPVSWRQL